jgi:very-short-patch-repair endonuclease
MKFKRQALIGRYIVDFVSFQKRLVVEARVVNTLKAKTIYDVRVDGK